MNRRWTGLLLAGVTALGLFTGCGSEKKGAPAAQEKAPAAAQAKGPLTLEYTYNKKEGMASNQMAAWIEDKDGKVVRTLFATKFTAQGGYKKREQALPVWVKKSGLAQLDKAKVDALTKATLYMDSDALYTGTFQKGGKEQTLDMKASLTKEPEKKENKDLITGVKAVYRP
ncbi:DUF2271 domain-containing protein [Acidaminococcus massiliensis]|uniref:DUF2271 domain-containing protein n=1 Tax=Acidaminococcus massiliensis TaxID=1852375 RepID=UPI0023F58405|nr:DUF2271 domain-containing protein [Acidaminococcus massiliensis]